MIEPVPQPQPEEVREALETIRPEFRQFLDRNYGNRSIYRVAGIDDLEQDVLAAALRSLGLGRFAVESDLRTDLKRWLAGITRNIHNNAFKTARKAAASLEQDAFDNAHPDQQTPSRTVAADEQWQLFIDWLAGLGPEDTALVRMVYVDKRTHEEVGQLRGQSRHQVFRELQRLLNAAREILFSSGMWKRLEKRL